MTKSYLTLSVIMEITYKQVFNTVRQKGRSGEEYEAEFFSLVNHVDYMANDYR